MRRDIKMIRRFISLAFLVHFVYLKNQSFFLRLVADLGLVVVWRAELHTDVCWIAAENCFFCTTGWVWSINLGFSFGSDTWWASVGSVFFGLLCEIGSVCFVSASFGRRINSFSSCLSVAWMREICCLTLFYHLCLDFKVISVWFLFQILHSFISRNILTPHGAKTMLF